MVKNLPTSRLILDNPDSNWMLNPKMGLLMKNIT